MKTSYFFGENNLKSFFRPGWKGILCTVSDYNPVEYLLFKHKQFLILVDGHYESRMHK